MVNLENIPSYLKDNARFCNWKYETCNGKLTKVPYNPYSNERASVNDTSTFSDFDLAVSKLDIYDGIGIKVDGKLIAIDLDHCIENEKLSSWAEEIISHFKNTYIEISPSGNGLRIVLLNSNGFLYDKENYYIKKGNVEVYVSDEQFIKMSSNYEKEQSTLTLRIKELESIIKEEQEKVANTNSFLNLVRNYTNITKLDAEIIRTFIEKVYVYTVHDDLGKKVKKLKIVFNFIGEINLPSKN